MRRFVRFSFVLVAISLTCVTSLLAGIDARMLRQPDVSKDQIAFVYAGDIWLVSKTGGQAHRLSTPPGEEQFPRFSPDGQWLAYTGNYDGNSDVYVVSTRGGVPTRLTFHPMPDRVLDWYPEGNALLFASGRASGKQRFNQLYRISPRGGQARKLPLPYGEFGAIADDGKRLAYTTVTRDFRTWKRYRGGTAPKIWIFDLDSKTSATIPNDGSNDSLPMWHGDTVYFHSDRGSNKRANIWAYDTSDGSVRQITRFRDFDVRFPAIGPSDLVFENGGRLYVMDLASEKVSEVQVEVRTDRATLKPRTENLSSFVRTADISPSGKRAVVEARGELFSVPAEHGPVLNLTHRSGSAERHPAWSPDGKSIAFFSDRDGEYELYLQSADGRGEAEQVTHLGRGYRYAPMWSPDSEKLVWIDQAMKIHMYDHDSKKVTEIDHGVTMFHGALNNFTVSWSSDSRWLAYDNDVGSRTRALFVYDTDNKKRHQLTSGFYRDTQPTFDPDGKYLYYRSNRSMTPLYSDFDNSFIYANSTRLMAAPLRHDVPSPLAPRNDEEEVKDEDEDEGKDDEDEDKADEEEEEVTVEIDLDGFERRAIVLPPEAGNYGNLAAVSGKLLYLKRGRTGAGPQPGGTITYYDLEEREEASIFSPSGGFSVSADGKKLLVASADELGIMDLAKDQKLDKPLDFSKLEMQLDPIAEWKQIFNDAWRIERDYFYDPGMHGVNWNEMRRRYGKLIGDAVTRWDVNFVIGELIGELSASHSYRGGGATETPRSKSVGLLGADFAVEDGAFRIKRILDGAEWDAEVRSPLRLAGADIEVGDYILAVNGLPLDIDKEIYASFQGLGGQTVELTVSDSADGADPRHVLIDTVSDDTRLRNLAWIESNRRRVEEATGGRVGYLYVPDTGIGGQNELVRMFQGQWDKDALIIDERFNSGGQIPDRFIELLNRPLYNWWGVRDGDDWQWPPVSAVGPKVMLVNEWSGSGGDAFPFYFRKAGLGPLIGTRTWGGLIGISGAPSLIDNGVVTSPTFGIYSTEGEWIIENHGVDPDIEVIDDPALMWDGDDPQLERAIEEILALLRKNPPSVPGKPAYPKR